MERYISNAIYDNTDQTREKCVEIAMIRLTDKLSKMMAVGDYLYIEEELNRIHAMIEREWFGRGVEEGIRLLLSCI